MLWLANASLSSIRSRSSTRSSARSSARRVAGTGPSPITDGSTPATAVLTTRARGDSPRERARSASTSTTAAAPSLIPELLPAVTVPSRRNAGLRRASPSAEVSAARMLIRLDERDGAIGVGHRHRHQLALEVTRRRWRQWCAAGSGARTRPDPRRLMPHRSATFSPVSPIDAGGYCSASRGLMNRQPRVVSTSDRLPRS